MKRFIFDMDGTLLTSDFSGEKEYFKSVYGNDSYRIMNGMSTRLDSYEKAYDKYEVGTLCRYLTYTTGLIVTPEILNGWNEVIGNSPTKLEDGVIELLEYLKDNGHSLAVLTGWFKEPQIKRLENVGIIKYFDNIYTGDMILKPHAIAYIDAKRSFKWKDCVMIGNDLNKDYMIPRSLDMNAIFYDKNNLQGDNIVKVKRMNEIIERF